MKNKNFFIFAILLLFSATLICPATREVTFGERPFIDIYQIPDQAMEHGKIRIEFKKEYEEYLDVNKITVDPNGTILFGITGLDDLNRLYEVRSVKRLFDSPALKGEFLERHRRWGFHLWFELSFESKENIRNIIMAYRERDQILHWVEPEYRKQLDVDAEFETETFEDMSRWIPNDPQLGNQWHYNNTGQQNGTPGADYYIVEATTEINSEFLDISYLGIFSDDVERVSWTREVSADEPYQFFRVRGSRLILGRGSE